MTDVSYEHIGSQSMGRDEELSSQLVERHADLVVARVDAADTERLGRTERERCT